MTRTIFSLLIFQTLFLLALDPPEWKPIEAGMEIAQYMSPEVVFVRVNPDLFEFKLYSASIQGGCRTARNWAEDEGLSVVTNAGMYQEDGHTSVGFLKQGQHRVNAHWASTYNAVLVFSPTRAIDGKSVKILDRTCSDLTDIEQTYDVLVQNYRLIDCRGQNTWSPSEKQWSMALLAQDTEGNILFIFTRTPFSTHNFIQVLRRLPLQLNRGMYLEGGKEATLYVRAKDLVIEKVGAFGSSQESKPNMKAWPVPNLIGIKRR
ncbi:MAG TPA: phosphodiester glycosidase family protein [Thermoanaerobaculia bacterium]|nr:phosphodiester glycosidase family protein [Thermoanaerobaculia bacterium]HUM30949.1 phosphodiester glycosidase family protein [Thermoanaerobaculia bacterium]HXK69391.1 phosphodiester glycosidase family protein [Thermoanaerobaculia bacterium]